jgi:hypothetical protein
MNVFDVDMPAGLTDRDVGSVDATSYTHADFKNDVEAALRAQFGRGGVSRATSRSCLPSEA